MNGLLEKVYTPGLSIILFSSAALFIYREFIPSFEAFYSRFPVKTRA